jgi:uncharacterized membrane protein YgcG
MKCTYCKKISFEDDASFCVNCGAKLVAASRDTRTVVTEDTSLTQVMILSGILNLNSHSHREDRSDYSTIDSTDYETSSSSNDSYSSSSSDSYSSSDSSSSSDSGGGGSFD